MFGEVGAAADTRRHVGALTCRRLTLPARPWQVWSADQRGQLHPADRRALHVEAPGRAVGRVRLVVVPRRLVLQEARHRAASSCRAVQAYGFSPKAERSAHLAETTVPPGQVPSRRRVHFLLKIGDNVTHAPSYRPSGTRWMACKPPGAANVCVAHFAESSPAALEVAFTVGRDRVPAHGSAAPAMASSNTRVPPSATGLGRMARREAYCAPCGVRLPPGSQM